MIMHAFMYVCMYAYIIVQYTRSPVSSTLLNAHCAGPIDKKNDESDGTTTGGNSATTTTEGAFYYAGMAYFTSAHVLTDCYRNLKGPLLLSLNVTCDT